MFETLKSLPLTFYSRPFYEDVVLHKKGFGFPYILVLVFLSLFGACCHFYGPLQYVFDQLEVGLSFMPDVAIKDGKLSIDKSLPFSTTLCVVDGQPLKLVIDTSFKDKDKQHIVDYMKKENAIILVTNTKAIAREWAQDNELDIRPFVPADDGIIKNADWKRLGHNMRYWMYPLLVICSSLIFLIAIYIAVLFVAFGAWLFAKMLGGSVSLEDAVRIAAVSGIPAGFIAALWFPLLPKLILWFGYALFAIGASRYARGRSR